MSNTARGGYQIVDGMNGKFVLGTVDSIHIPGIYNKALNQINKPCYFGGLTVLDVDTLYNIPFQPVTFKNTSAGLEFSVKPDKGGNQYTFFIDATDTLFVD